MTDAATPLHLAGNNRPVAEERDVLGAHVVGRLPDDLQGTFLRNGPNPRTGWSPHLFAGDGMVHGIAIADGRLRWYRNRYVRTPLYEHPGASRFDLAFDRATGGIDHRVTTANTHVVHHAGRVLALEEGGFPYELTADLDTRGPWTFGGRLETPMTAHPKTCPVTGELLFFGYQLRPPYLTYHRADTTGCLVQSVPIELPRATMMHDFAVTATRAVFLDSPFVFDPSAIAETGSTWRWDAARGARFGVMPRDGSGDEIRWIELDAFHLSHVANAHDDGHAVVLTGTRIGAPDGLPTMHRWTIDPSAGWVHEEALDDESSEYPRVPDALVGRPTRFEYVTSFVFEAEPDHHEVRKHDLVAGTRAQHRLPSGHTCGEPVFVPRGDGRAEDDGYLVTFAHDRATDTSYLLVLDADDVAGEPVAELHLPVRVPAGFHGTWLPSP